MTIPRVSSPTSVTLHIFYYRTVRNKKHRKEKLTTSDKIDQIVTNRWLALPIFAVVMFIVYYVSVTTVGGIATDWANDGVFGDGWYLFGIGDPYDGDEESRCICNCKCICRGAGDESVQKLWSRADDFDAQQQPQHWKSLLRPCLRQKSPIRRRRRDLAEKK